MKISAIGSDVHSLDDAGGTMPTVSIGLPVHNGETFVMEAIESVLNQSYTDWELLISDNASTDATEQLCREVAKKNARVHYSRSPDNIGAGPNFNRTLEAAQGRYFKWAAHDDRFDATFLERAVRVLDENPDIVLCTSRCAWIDSEGRRIGEYTAPLNGIDSDDPCVRFSRLSSLSHACLDVFGVIRIEQLRRAGGIAPFVGSDRSLLAELGLRGRFFRIPETLFFSRNHEARSIRMQDFRQRGQWWTPELAGRRIMPWWRLLAQYSRIISRCPVRWTVKARCRAGLVGWMRRNWRYLLADIIPQFTPRNPPLPKGLALCSTPPIEAPIQAAQGPVPAWRSPLILERIESEGGNV